MPRMSDGTLLGITNARVKERIGLQIVNSGTRVTITFFENLWNYIDLIEIIQEGPDLVYSFRGCSLARYLKSLSDDNPADFEIWHKWLQDKESKGEFDKWIQKATDYCNSKSIYGYREIGLIQHSNLSQYLLQLNPDNRLSGIMWIKHLNNTQRITNGEFFASGLKDWLLDDRRKASLLSTSDLASACNSNQCRLRILQRILWPPKNKASDLPVVKNTDRYKTQESYLLYTQHGGREYREWIVQAPHWHHHHTFQNHFGVFNLLVHFRTTFREGKNKEKIFFLEELQSDLWKYFESNFDKKEQSERPFLPWRRKDLIELGIKVFLYCSFVLGKEWVAWSNAQMVSVLFGTSPESIYDHYLPGYMRILEKNGAGRCGTLQIWTQEPQYAPVFAFDCWHLCNRDGLVLKSPFEDHAAALQYLKEVTSPKWVTVNGFHPNPEFKQMVLERGVPTFGKWLFDDHPFIPNHDTGLSLSVANG